MLGTRIASLRQNLGMSQATLAQRLHISPSTVGMYEQGRREPSVATLIALSREFGVSLDYLLLGQPNTVQDISALHRLMEDACRQPQMAQESTFSKEEIVCHLLWALLG